jgi:hypothetical protein
MANIKLGSITWELQQPKDTVNPLQCFCGEMAVYIGYHATLDVVPKLSESFNVWQCVNKHATTRSK